ncbi:MAG: hypothetical protein JNK48_22340 [Bryobacterales bacterium]|nr:hypothetical protein [Bryobacterales bacterium]
MPLENLIRSVARRYPGFQVEDIRFNTAGLATLVQIAKVRAKDRKQRKVPGSYLQLVIDPKIGRVLKTVDRHAGVWAFLRNLHHDLLAARTGRVENGLSAAAREIRCLRQVQFRENHSLDDAVGFLGRHAELLGPIHWAVHGGGVVVVGLGELVG